MCQDNIVAWTWGGIGTPRQAFVRVARLQDQNQKNVLIIWSEHNYILSHRLVHTTTCFGPVYWPSPGCIINLISSYTICAWGTLGDEISSYSSGWHGLWVTVDRCSYNMSVP